MTTGTIKGKAAQRGFPKVRFSFEAFGVPESACEAFAAVTERSGEFAMTSIKFTPAPIEAADKGENNAEAAGNHNPTRSRG